MTRLVPDETNFGHRAPAVEALIDIRVEGSVDVEALRLLSDDLAEQLPELQTQFELRQRLAFAEDGPTSQVERQGVRGFLRKNSDAVVQLRRDGFTYSKLAPYTRWHDVCAAAQAHWVRYVEKARPERIVRLAVRYINHIRPPDGWVGSAEWLQIAVAMPSIPGIPSQPRDFFVRLNQPHPTANHQATVTVASALDADQRRVLLFDIDVHHQGVFAPADEQIWEILAELRDFKNDIFFGSITTATRRLLNNGTAHG